MPFKEVKPVRSLRLMEHGPDYDRENDLVGVVLSIKQIVYVRQTSTGTWFVDRDLMQESLKAIRPLGLGKDLSRRSDLDVPYDLAIGKKMRFRFGASMDFIRGETLGAVANFILIHRNSVGEPTELTLVGTEPRIG